MSKKEYILVEGGRLPSYHWRSHNCVQHYIHDNENALFRIIVQYNSRKINSGTVLFMTATEGESYQTPRKKYKLAPFSTLEFLINTSCEVISSQKKHHKTPPQFKIDRRGVPYVRYDFDFRDENQLDELESFIFEIIESIIKKIKQKKA